MEYNILNICVELPNGVHKVTANHLKNNERMRYLTKIKRFNERMRYLTKIKRAGFGLLNK